MKNHIGIILTAILLALTIPSRISGQISFCSVDVRSYTIGDGLTHNKVQDFAQDENNYVWLATFNGLERFDGYNFRNFKTRADDDLRLEYNRIISVNTGPTNGLWCQTIDSRLYVFDTHNEKFIDPFALHPEVRRCDKFDRMTPLADGVLWLSGRDGSLWRLDGRHYNERGAISFFPATHPERGEKIYGICSDGHGGEWILSNRGYWVYGRPEFSGRREFVQIVASGNGVAMIDRDGRLACYDADSNMLRDITLHQRLRTDMAPFLMNDGRIAVGLPNGGLARVNLNSGDMQVTDLKTDNAVIFYYEQLPAGGSEHCLWALTDTDILRINLDSNECLHLQKPYTDRTDDFDIQFVYRDPTGEIWVCPAEGHLCHYNSQTRSLEQKYCYTDNVLSTIPKIIIDYMIDDRGNLWGSTDLGFHKITFSTEPAAYLTYSDNPVRSLMLDHRGWLWTGSKDTRVRIYDNTYKHIGNLTMQGNIVPDGNACFGEQFYAMYEDSRGRIWLGSKYNGLYIASPRPGGGYDIKHYPGDASDVSGLSFSSIYSFCEDGKGRMWVGTFGGGPNLVQEEADGRITFVSPLNGGMPSYPISTCNRVRHITRTSRGEIAMATSGGLVTFSEDFRSTRDINFNRNRYDVDRDSTISNTDVFYVYEDSGHRLFLTTMGGGLCRLEGNTLLSDSLKFSVIDMRDGLPSDMVYSIHEVGKDSLWLSMGNSISRYIPSTGEIEIFNRFDFHAPFITTEAPFVVDSQGVATFALNNGVLQADLPHLSKSSYAPKIAFYDAFAYLENESSVSLPMPDGKLCLDKSQRNISVSFVALDFANTENISYSYRLKGLNDNWVNNGHNHSAYFYALPAGDYVLEVRATNGEGVWSDKAYSLPIHIEPTFIETIWAKLLYLLGFLAIGLTVWYVSVYILRLKRRINVEQELTRLKLRFFTDVSHELRTPLTLIVNPIDEVMADPSLSASSREYMAVAKSNTDRMLRLINQFLDIRKIQNSKMRIFIEKVDVAPLLRRIFNDFGGMARSKEITFSLEMKALEIPMYTDVDKFEKIVFNLLSNAFKYTPDGMNVTLGAIVEDSCIKIWVRDQGPGMEDWQKTSMFRRFENFGLRRQTASTGIGLSLVKELVDILHGNIIVESVKDEGSCFTVSLPTAYEIFSNDANVELILNDDTSGASESEATIPTVYTPQSPTGEKTHILVVEDNAELRRMLCRMLCDTYTVSESADGQDALEKIQISAPDIIISDIMMPRMDGLELLRRVRADRDYSHLPFVLLSAKASVYERVDGLECGADDYLTKPFSATYLRARLKSLLMRRSRLRDYFLSAQSNTSASQPSMADDKELPVLTAYDTNFITRLLEYVERESVRPDLTIDEIAVEMKLGRTVFNRKVKSLLNVTPVELLSSVRLRKAVKLLDEDTQTVSEIAYKCGFSSPQYFNRVFRENHGCTPLEYRTRSTKT